MSKATNIEQTLNKKVQEHFFAYYVCVRIESKTLFLNQFSYLLLLNKAIEIAQIFNKKLHERLFNLLFL